MHTTSCPRSPFDADSLACDECLSSSGLEDVRPQAHATAPEMTTIDGRKRRTRRGTGLNSKKMCIDRHLRAPCELDEGIASVEIVADLAGTCIAQSDTDKPQQETNELLKVSLSHVRKPLSP